MEYIFACSSGTLSPMQRNGFPAPPEAVATIEGRVSAIKYFHGHHSVPYLSGNVASAENIRSVLSALKAVMNEEESAGESQMPWREFRQAVGALSAESPLERAILLVSHFGRLSPPAGRVPELRGCLIRKGERTDSAFDWWTRHQRA